MHARSVYIYLHYRADEKWDDNTAMVYYTIRDPENVNLTVNLYTSAYPFTEVTEFDTNLGDHDGFLLMGPYIFAQRTDNDVVGLYVSYDRQPFQKALIPTPYAHQRYVTLNCLFMCAGSCSYEIMCFKYSLVAFYHCHSLPCGLFQIITIRMHRCIILKK